MKWAGMEYVVLEGMPEDVLVMASSRQTMFARLGDPTVFREFDYPMSVEEIVREAKKFHEENRVGA